MSRWPKDVKRVSDHFSWSAEAQSRRGCSAGRGALMVMTRRRDEIKGGRDRGPSALCENTRRATRNNFRSWRPEAHLHLMEERISHCLSLRCRWAALAHCCRSVSCRRSASVGVFGQKIKAAVRNTPRVLKSLLQSRGISSVASALLFREICMVEF